MKNPAHDEQVGVADIQALTTVVADNIGRVMVGMEPAVERILVAALSGGHVLLEDVPGVGKTMLARSLAVSLGCTFARIQCTPDLLPSDVTGVSIFDPQEGTFVFRRGPVMSQVVLADEINRATPRTQSSLLECMGEGQVTVDGTTYRLPAPFMVLATQNPVEYEGTFPLPEAQLDRFFLKLRLGYPSQEQEAQVLRRLQRGHPISELKSCTTPEHFTAMQQEIRQVFVEDSVADYMVRVVQATRRHADAALGASPRGSLALFRAAQALAAIRGRDFVLPDDVKELAVSVLGHRVLVQPESRLRGRTPEQIVTEVLQRTEIGFEPQL